MKSKPLDEFGFGYDQRFLLESRARELTTFRITCAGCLTERTGKPGFPVGQLTQELFNTGWRYWVSNKLLRVGAFCPDCLAEDKGGQ
jgi:hypothetical protein